MGKYSLFAYLIKLWIMVYSFYRLYNLQFSIAETNEEKIKNEEDPKKKYPYPKSVFLIISTEFCERFSFYGMKSKYE